MKRVLAVTHGPSVGPGVFADAVAAAGHELTEWQVPLGGRPPAGADAVLVFGGGMHPDEEHRHGWLGGRAPLARRAARDRHARARRLPRLAAARSGGGSGGLPRRASPRSAGCRSSAPRRAATTRSAARCPSASTRSSGTTTPTRSLRARSSWPGAASACRRSGSAAPGASSSTRRCGASRSSAGSPRSRTTSPTPEALRAATQERIGAWNELGRGLCAAFLETV